jgi:hypothetical protein
MANENGSGNIVSETRKTGSFTRVEIHDLEQYSFFSADNLNPDNYQVEIIQGEREGIEAKGEDNIMKVLNTKVRSGILHIYFEKPVNLSKILHIAVYMKNIEALENCGPGYLYANGEIKASNLDLSANGSGLIRMAYRADHITGKVSGSGDAFFSGNSYSSDWYLSGSGMMKNGKIISSNKTLIHISGSGSIQMFLITKFLNSRLSGSGSLILSGKADNHQMTVSGSGSIISSELETKTGKVRISGSGNVEISVSDQIEAVISGSGNIYYHGRPAINFRFSGSGRVMQK